MLLVTVIFALVISLGIFAARQEKERYRERATLVTQNIARLLDQNVSNSFDKVDVILRSVAIGYQDLEKQGRSDPANVNAYLAQQESLIPELTSLRIADREGVVRFGGGIPAAKPVNLSDRDYFIRARDDANGSVVISGPVFARISQQWVIVLARRINAPDGSFGGIAYANLGTAYFEKILSSVALGPHGAATIRTTDLALVHRFPDTKNAIGSRDVSKQLRAIMERQSEQGDYSAETQLDGIERSNAYRKLARYPFYVIVGIATDDYLGGWQSNVLFLAGLSALTLLVTGLAAAFVYCSAQRLKAEISERERAGDQLRIAAVAFQSRDGMMVTDANGVIMQVNQAFCDVTGYTASEAVGQTPALLRSGRQDAAFYRTMWEAIEREGHWEGEIWNRRRDGGIYPEWLSISSVTDPAGKVTHFVGTFSDISEPREAERKILELAFYDPLTSLPNRRLMLDRLHHALDTHGRTGKLGAVLLVDLDHFKTLNDTQGHDAGDELLIEIAKRLRDVVRKGDSVARLGGDEFVVLLENLNEEPLAAANAAKTLAGKLRVAIAQPVRLKGGLHRITPSIGVTIFGEGMQGADSLLKQADLALYQAKGNGRNKICFYNAEMQAAMAQRVELEAGLRRALAEDELILHYQPQVDVHGRLIGAEALLRWQPPDRPMVSPVVFISIAEECGLILSIGDWVLETACRQLAAWNNDPAGREIDLAVNISARQFAQPDFVERVIGALRGSGANPARLKLELTESLVLDDVEKVIQTMEELKALGISFSIDDFGTGYSSLSYLKRLPLNQIKIDRSFVRNLAEDADDRSIIQAIISLGCSLGLQVIAEGVETEAQQKFLADHGCHAFQGYLFGHPGPATNLDCWFEKGLLQP